ncbi:MAG: DUF1926 domain-containing protein [Chloroflexota bacterium]|nr:MAG: DUF1926 domain-containing protein [Chloroflexota bacterium]
MQKRISLGLAIHNHQPVGNFPFVFEELYKKAYEPMIRLLERHPRVRLAMHYSGPLLDWLEAERPELLERLAGLVRSGQVEIMTGAYYEPILPMIPDRDKVAQVASYTAQLRRRFGCEPSGLWLAERVWEPTLPSHLAQAGIDYVVLDDSHFRMSGISDDDLFGYYLTEDQNNLVKVFPTLKPLRYSIPWSEVGTVLDFLRAHATEDGRAIAVMGDDGEKFGGWPGTFEHCYERGWLDNFFSALEQNADWVETVHLGRWAREQQNLGVVYLPTASYPEMMEWALPAKQAALYERLTHELANKGEQDVLSFMRGGFWRNFLVKYPEINAMQKKMMVVHDKVWTMPDTEDRERALRELWKGQCNCPYWHGVFGGIYLTHIRAAVFEHLIKAENAAEAKLDSRRLVYRIEDYDKDGREEAILESQAQNLYLRLSDGGGLVEWDHRGRNFNLACTMSRRPEAYHQLLAAQPSQQSTTSDTPASSSSKTIHDGIRSKQQDIGRYLAYDWYRRTCLLDHFLSSATRLEDFARCSYGEDGDFVNQPYTIEIAQSSDELSAQLRRVGHAWVDGQFLPLDVQKTIRLLPGAPDLTVDYVITNLSNIPIDLIFGSEWNLNLLAGGHNPDAYVEIPGQPVVEPYADATSEHQNVREIRLGNRWLDISVAFTFSRSGALWRFPVDTVSNSEGGVETVYQGTCLLPHWKLHLGPGESWDLRLGARLS